MSLPMGAAYQIFLRAKTMHLITQWRLGGKEIQRTWPCPSERVGRTTPNFNTGVGSFRCLSSSLFCGRVTDIRS
jgi:hypothetical protein